MTTPLSYSQEVELRDVAHAVAIVVAVVSRWEADHEALRQRALAEISNLADQADALRINWPHGAHAVLDGAIESAFRSLSRCASAGASTPISLHPGETGDCCSAD